MESEKWEAKLESSADHASTMEYFGVDRIDKEHVSNKNDLFVYDGIGALDNLRITYKPSWPIDLIIDRDSIQVYNEIMCVLLQVKRVKYNLDHLHQTIGNEILIIERKLFQHNVRHTESGVLNYEQDTVYTLEMRSINIMLISICFSSAN